MKILFLTQYYPPEVGAPAFRVSDLAIRLKSYGHEVTVYTAMPNYPAMEIHQDYRRRFYHKENIHGIKVLRSWIFVSKRKSVVLRLFSYFSFVLTSALIGFFTLRKQDLLICESPPLFLGISALFLAKCKRAKLVFNVSDLWPESAMKLNIVTNPVLIRLASALESRLYRKSVLVTGQTQGICKDIARRFPAVRTFWWRNGIDPYVFPGKCDISGYRNELGYTPADKVFLYAGILGHAQALDVILKAAYLLKDKPDIKFLIVGEGPLKQELIKSKLDLDLTQLKFYPLVQRETMVQLLSLAFATIIPLKKIELFRGAIPSKIFESLAMKTPILLGVDGEARELFINQGKCGLFFEPENELALVEAIEILVDSKDRYQELADNARNFVLQHFNREKIAWELSLQLEKL